MRWGVFNRRLGIALAALAVLAGALWLAQRIAVDRAVARERERLAGVAALAATNFRRQVDTFELVTTTLSADPEVGRVLEGGDPAAAARLNDRLATLTDLLDASVIYLMNANGDTVVASNWRQPDSFLGDNYRFRSYFTQAMATGRASQFALGTRSRIPGLFLARRIDNSGRPAGVLVVKIRFDVLEREWARSIGEAFVSDRDGVIVISSDPALRFRTIAPISDARRQELRAGRNFGPAPLILHPAFAAGQVLQGGSWRGQEELSAAIDLGGGRRLTVLTPIRSAAIAARNVAWLAMAALIMIAAGAAAALAARRRIVRARADADRQRQVAELQDRLEQANRLSSLGQVAAGVGHEINQPLAAIGMRASNAARLIERGQAGQASAALAEIEGLVERIGLITGELRQFARRAERKVGPVRLSAAFAGLSLLMDDIVRQRGGSLEIELERADLAVVAEQTRLEQVLVNLVRNALEAQDGGAVIKLAAYAAGERVHIRVSDNGPGIAPALKAALFQPFISSKGHGLGLGLVISRDIVAEFRGELTLLECAGGGAAFLIDLERAR